MSENTFEKLKSETKINKKSKGKLKQPKENKWRERMKHVCLIGAIYIKPLVLQKNLEVLSKNKKVRR